MNAFEYSQDTTLKATLISIAALANGKHNSVRKLENVIKVMDKYNLSFTDYKV